MTAYMSNIRFNNNSNTLIKAWGSAINAGLSAVGLVQTTDTGQINWSTTTVTATTTNQTLGYEVWRFNDSLQSTAPVFIRLAYGTTPNGATYCALTMSVGTGVDGAGNLTGLISTIRGGNADTAIGNPTNAFRDMNYGQPCWFFSDLSSFCMALTPGINTNPNANPSIYLWMVERTRNADNSPNADGIVFVCHIASRVDSQYYTRYNYISRVASSVYGSNFYMPIPYTSNDYPGSVDGTSFVTYPLLVAMPKPEAQSPTLIGWQNGMVNFQTVSLVVNGAARTYLALPAVAGAMPGTTTENSNGARNWCSLLMRYE